MSHHTTGIELVASVLAKRHRPASVRQVTDKLQKPDGYSERFTEDQVRHWLEKLVEQGLATRSRGRWRRSVRYTIVRPLPFGAPS